MINLQNISLNSTIIQSKGNIVSDMDGEKVMMSITNGKYYNLGEIGGIIWDLIKESISINDLISKLMTKFVVGIDECREQVISFLEQLHKEGLICILDKNNS
jgi:hypothetical protein